MECPKCGREVEEGAFICPGCEFILDTTFLGDDITDDERDVRPKAVVMPVDFGQDAMILGDGIGDYDSFETGDAGVSRVEATNARFYIGGALQQMLAPETVPELAPGVVEGNLKLTPFESHILGFINGKRSVGRIQKKSAMDEVEFKTALAMLTDKGIVRPSKRKKKPRPTPTMSGDASHLSSEGIPVGERTVLAPYTPPLDARNRRGVEAAGEAGGPLGEATRVLDPEKPAWRFASMRIDEEDEPPKSEMPWDVGESSSARKLTGTKKKRVPSLADAEAEGFDNDPSEVKTKVAVRVSMSPPLPASISAERNNPSTRELLAVPSPDVGHDDDVVDEEAVKRLLAEAPVWPEDKDSKDDIFGTDDEDDAVPAAFRDPTGIGDAVDDDNAPGMGEALQSDEDPELYDGSLMEAEPDEMLDDEAAGGTGARFDDPAEGADLDDDDLDDDSPLGDGPWARAEAEREAKAREKLKVDDSFYRMPPATDPGRMSNSDSAVPTLDRSEQAVRSEQLLESDEGGFDIHISTMSGTVEGLREAPPAVPTDASGEVDDDVSEERPPARIASPRDRTLEPDLPPPMELPQDALVPIASKANARAPGPSSRIHEQHGPLVPPPGAAPAGPPSTAARVNPFRTPTSETEQTRNPFAKKQPVPTSAQETAVELRQPLAAQAPAAAPPAAQPPPLPPVSVSVPTETMPGPGLRAKATAAQTVGQPTSLPQTSVQPTSVAATSVAATSQATSIASTSSVQAPAKMRSTSGASKRAPGKTSKEGAPIKVAPPKSTVSHEIRRKAEKIFEQAQKDLIAGNVASARMNAKLATNFDNSVPAYKEFVEEIDRQMKGKAPSAGTKAPQPPELRLFEEASIAEGKGDLKKAVKLLEDAIEVNPKAGPLYNRLGVILATRLKRFDEALAHLKRAVELEPGNLVYMNNFSKVTGMQQSALEKAPERGDKKTKTVPVKKMRPKLF
jgi:hypothetical protein